MFKEITDNVFKEMADMYNDEVDKEVINCHLDQEFGKELHISENEFRDAFEICGATDLESFSDFYGAPYMVAFEKYLRHYSLTIDEFEDAITTGSYFTIIYCALENAYKYMRKVGI